MNKTQIKLIDNFSVGEQVKCYCNKCQKVMNHTITKSIKEEFEDTSDQYGPDGFADYQIIKCLGCDSISFREYRYFSEYVDQDSNGTWELLFPESAENQHALHDFDELPYNLETVYKEAVECFNNNQYILCATGIRSILDGICIDRKVKKGQVEVLNKDNTAKTKYSFGLDGKINGLMENGLITKSQTKALHELRFMGNKAVHELEIPSKKDLLMAFDIIEHMLVDIYDLPTKSKKLESNRIQKGEKT